MHVSNWLKNNQTPGASPAGDSVDWLLAGVIVVALFVAYAITTPRTVALEDDGLFIMASVHAGVAHPPGYPLYTILGHIFSYLPIDPPAYRIHLLSGLFGGLACAVFFLALQFAGLARWFAFVAALAYGYSEHFWSQAIIAEVYTLNALLTFSVLLFCLRALNTDIDRRVGSRKGAGRKNAGFVRELSLAAFCFGLGLANHWPLIILAFPAFTWLLWPRSKYIWTHLPMLLGIALATAGLLYMWMVWRSLNTDVVTFYGPLDTFDKFWYYISREGYGSVDVSPSAGIVDQLLFVWHFMQQLFTQFTVVGVALAAAGIYWLYSNKGQRLLAASVWIFFAHSLLLTFMLRFDYEFLNLAVIRPYPLVAYAMMAFWVGCGLTFVWEKLQQALPDWSGKTAFNLLPVLALAVPCALLYTNFTINDRRDDKIAEQYARVLLEGLEENAVLFVTGDLPTSPVGYLRYAENVRPDVTLMNTQGLVYPTRLFSPPVTKQLENSSIEKFVREASRTRPVYFTANILEFPNPYGAIHYGWHEKAQRDVAASSMQLRHDDNAEMLFQSLVDDPFPVDIWNRHLHDRLMQQYGEYVGYMVLSGVSDPEWSGKAERKVAAMQDYYYGLIGMSEMLIKHGGPEQLAIAQEWVKRADTLMGETLSKEMKGRHYYRHGFIAYRLNNRDEAKELFERSLEVYDHPDNPSLQALDLVQPKKNAKAR